MSVEIPEDAVKAAHEAYLRARENHGGFLYGHHHVIRDFRKPGPEQEVWSIEERDPDDFGMGNDYERCHNAMVDELNMIAMRAALEAAKGKAA